MGIMATQDDCDSDADTVCLVWDSESDIEKTPKERTEITFGNDAQRILPPRDSRHSPHKRKCGHRDNGVIYVRASDSESDGEDNVIVIDDSPKRLDVPSDLPEDFFDCDTPPASPQRILQNEQDHVLHIPQEPEFSMNESITYVERKRRKRMKEARVLLYRIDEQLLQHCQYTRHDEQHNTTHTHHKEVISVDVHEKPNHQKSIEQLNKSLPSQPIVTQKGEKIIQKNVHDPRKEKLSIDESLSLGESIKVTLKIPLSKLLEIENNKKQKLQTEIVEYEYVDKDNKKSCTTQELPRSEKTEYKLKNTNGKSHKKRNVQQEDAGVRISSVSEKDVSAGRSKKKKLKKDGVGSVCELCRTRVANVTDHIVHEHSNLFT